MPGVCGHDLLSNLPGPLIEEILNWLPLRDAVRTSILSRAWRHHWKTIRRLDFDLRDPDSYLEKPGYSLKFLGMAENLGLVQVLAGSPHLRRLEIICSARKRDNYCTKTRRRSAPVNETEVMNSTWGVLKELRSFDIVYMTDSEIKYVESILARAPALETLGVHFKGASLLEALNLLPRASPNVKMLQLSSTDLPDW
ncbi:hypothetical protein H6P81_020849 [Aristolochia fimbriata]|uniref:F-box domain-containing protein n=1 Tax=Aristolochia fimbriata TaxID=158543 RepID=A0AAV7DWN1_ARIFI|nr:hypothetical protein H6P81_020849 [Aristolochia fimbriata]